MLQSSQHIRRAMSSSSRAARSVPAGTAQRRSVHTLRALPYSVDEGLGAFLPPDALKAVGVEYQQGLLDRINDYVSVNKKLDGMSIAQTIIETASSREDVQVFNWASHALNNSFFLDHLKPTPSGAESHERALEGENSSLKSRIRVDFQGMDMLKTTIAGTAAGMAGSGHVWLVSDQDGRLAVLPTFASGTLLVRARQMSNYAKGYYGDADRTKEADARAYQHTNNTPEPVFGGQRRTWAADATFSPASGVTGARGSPPSGSRTLATGAGSGFNVATPTSIHGVSAPAVRIAQDVDTQNRTEKPTPLSEVGNVIWPLMCVSIHERNWVSAGFGPWGLEKWLGEFWTVLDWSKVAARHRQIMEKSGKHSMSD